MGIYLKPNVSQLGYKNISPYKNASHLLINTPSGKITMKGVNFPLLGIANGEVRVMKPNEEHQFKSNRVLEIPLKKKGGKVSKSKMYPHCACGCKSEFNPKILAKFLKGGEMAVLDENGNTQMTIQGGERIFSRIATKEILSLTKLKDYEKLGKFIVEELKRQDKRKPEYVKE